MNRSLFREHQILRQALAALEKNLSRDFKLEAPTKTVAQALPHTAAGAIRVKRNQRTWDFVVEVKPTLPKAYRFLLYMEKERSPQMVLITTFVNPIAAEEMKQQGLQFIDTAGNTYLSQEGLFLFIKGNRPHAEHIKTGRTFVFQATGLKMVFALLCEQQLANQTYREIAKAADVALGTVGILMKEIRDRGFLLDDETGGCKLINKRELFEQWVTGYVHKLRPKLALGRFRGEDQLWDHWQLAAGVWGGEVAAAKYTQDLQPEFATIYATAEKMQEIVVKHRLKQDPEGNIEILKKFWKHPDPFPGLAHPLITYADLTAIGNQRNLETARMVYDNQILKLIGQD